MPWWVWCQLVFSIKFEFSAMNLQPNGFLLQKCGTLTKGININVGRKTNMSRAHAQAHKKQVQAVPSSQNKKGSISDFVLRRDVFCSIHTRNLHSGACLPCEIASSQTTTRAWTFRPEPFWRTTACVVWARNYSNCGQAIHSGIFNKTTESHSIILRPKGKLLHRCVELACAK